MVGHPGAAQQGNETGLAQGKPGAGWIAAIVATVVLAVGLRLWWFSIVDILHPDELMQYLEQGNRLATGHGIMPWESRFGLRNALIPQLLSLPLSIGHALAPGTLAAVWAARLCFAALTLLALHGAWMLGAQSGRAHALLALFVAAVWWESVLYSDLLLSESLAAALMLPAAALVLDPASSRRRLALAGLLLGLGVLVRLQFSVFAGLLVVGALGLDRRRWGAVIAGGIVALAIGAASDLAGGLTPFSWVWTNVALNVGQDRASRFGTAGPVAYLALMREHLRPILPLVLVAALSAGPRYRPLFYAALANIAVHSLIPHKEYRFIWISVLALLVLAAIGTMRLPEWIASRRARALDGRARAAWLAALACAWAATSAWSAHAIGGIPAFRLGGTLPRLAQSAARDPRTCAIAIVWDHKGYLVPALLPRRVPILLVPHEPGQSRPELPDDLARGANALVLPMPPKGRPEYQEQGCGPFADARLCLYVRKGGCEPAPEWDYQRMLEKHDL